ncbi:hypothetical protein DFO70_102455 [Cytobacillus firmus]|uniref:Uncharacterized protein n=2 Tax=Cytobacillus TaxID=2675230 RepID=A0A366K4Q9_CYTFI|nr:MULTISPECIES: hypothetical protein [Cytobacillus]RBP96128.1 hypothetical protein DFO70_102455 [Cytobacillus firmus]TDX45041.1 hypothetical protein DFO72_103455 [Cytobacillus oceanisediminis]
MRLRDLTLDELEDLEQELHENGEQSNFGYYAKLECMGGNLKNPPPFKKGE